MRTDLFIMITLIVIYADITVCDISPCPVKAASAGDVITLVIKLLWRRSGRMISEGVPLCACDLLEQGKCHGEHVTSFWRVIRFFHLTLIKVSARVNVNAAWEQVRSVGNENQMAFLICRLSALWMNHFIGLSLFCGCLSSNEEGCRDFETFV